MVNPLWILIIALGIAFLISLLDKIGKSFAMLVFFSALVVITAISAQWFFHLLYGGESINIFTAGYKPPFSINLKVGLIEAVFLFLINLAALMSAFYLTEKFRQTKSYALSLYLSLVLGLNGLIMTRDLFNVFVFLEITSIATYALIGLDRNIRSLSGGFKYVIAGGIASALFLLGTIYIYKFTGSLNIDYIVASKHLLAGKTGFIAVFLLLSAILIELKPFPANGWALDVYQSAHPGISALISSASSAAIFFVFYKILPFVQADLVSVVSVLGMITFIFSNLLGLKQTSTRRLLGYSSIGQIGLLIAALTLITQFQYEVEFAGSIFIIVGGLFINHFFAKAGLFWLAGIVKGDKLSDWKILNSASIKLIMFGSFLFALIGLPPFPGFWAKWELIMHLASNNMTSWIFLILLGSILEAIYLLRWFGIVVKAGNQKEVDISFDKSLPVSIFFLFLYLFGLIISDTISGFD